MSSWKWAAIGNRFVAAIILENPPWLQIQPVATVAFEVECWEVPVVSLMMYH